MKLLVDFLPILIFFGTYKVYGIYAATAVLMVCTLLQMAYIYKTEGRLETMHKITLALVLVFGMLTLVLQNEAFIKWKPTVLYSAMSLALAVYLWGFKKNVLHLMLGKQLQVPSFVWHKLCIAWVAYTAFMAALNAYVAHFYTTDQWVNFKLWGYAFPLVFLLAQGLYIAKHIQQDE